MAALDTQHRNAIETVCITVNDGKIRPSLCCDPAPSIPEAELVSLTQAFRCLRDCCRADEEHQIEIGTSGVQHRALLFAVEQSRAADLASGVELCVKMALQFLCNLAAACESNKAMIWDRYFSDALMELVLSTKRHRRLLAFAIALTHSCCAGEESSARERLSALASHKAFCCLLTEVVLHEQDDAFGWLEYLFAGFVRGGLHGEVVQSVGRAAEVGLRSVTPEQVIALRMLETVTEDEQELALAAEGGFGCWLVEALEQLTNDVEERSRDEMGMQEEATDCVIRMTGRVLGSCKEEKRLEMVTVGGLLQWCLDLLARCGSSSGNAHRASDITRLVGNACFRCSTAQDLVREHSGIPLLLQQGKFHPENGLTREWMLLAVRNLCEGNEANQRAVEEAKQQIDQARKAYENARGAEAMG